MKYPKFLLPYTWKTFMLIIFLVSLLLGALTTIGEITPAFLDVNLSFLPWMGNGSSSKAFSVNNLADELATFLVLISGLGLMFCSEKNEDELIAVLRLNAMYWAIAVNTALLILATFLFYDFKFFNVMLVNLISVPVLFLTRFQWLLFTLRSSGER